MHERAVEVGLTCTGVGWSRTGCVWTDCSCNAHFKYILSELTQRATAQSDSSSPVKELGATPTCWGSATPSSCGLKAGPLVTAANKLELIQVITLDRIQKLIFRVQVRPAGGSRRQVTGLGPLYACAIFYVCSYACCK